MKHSLIMKFTIKKLKFKLLDNRGASLIDETLNNNMNFTILKTWLLNIFLFICFEIF